MPTPGEVDVGGSGSGSGGDGEQTLAGSGLRRREGEEDRAGGSACELWRRSWWCR